MKQKKPLLTNIIALIIILGIGLSLSNLMMKYLKVDQGIYFSANNSFPQVEDPMINENKEEEILNNYESEQYVEKIIEDLNLAEECLSAPPRLALIIDDLGYEREIASKIIDLEFPLALSILPYLKFSQELAEKGKNSNQEIMLHLPMEANDENYNPGPGAIKMDMLEEEIRQAVRGAIFDFPNVIGVNNHMGSKITENQKIMRIILQEIKRYQLFFVDSLTSKNSIAYKLAREMGVKTAVRSVFLDNENDLDYIAGQLKEAKEFALKNGVAIAIGHARINTYYVLNELIPELINEGIEIVPISTIVK
ncbi:MAG: hypothetical protein Kow00103_13210 [Candidatus Caldatribacteriota bacterium]